MSQPYIGEIKMFGGTFAPAGWAFCAGQLMAISENDTLFNLIGTTYGGDGQSTFGLPDMRGRVVIHQGQGGGLSNYNLAQTGGSESVTLPTFQQIPQSTTISSWRTPTPRRARTPAGNQTVAFENVNQSPMPYSYYPYDGSAQVTLPANSIQATGGSQPHDNIQPVIALNFCISLFGVLPDTDLIAAQSSAFPTFETETHHGNTFRRASSDLRVQFRSQGLGVLPRSAHAAVAEHGAVLAAGHDLWRRRQVELPALPNIQGQGAISLPDRDRGLSLYDLGEQTGAQNVSLLSSEIPSHPHGFVATTNGGTTQTPAGAQLAVASSGSKAGSISANYLSTNSAQTSMTLALGFTGGNQPHNNMQPYLTMNYCIALQGVYPPRG